MPEPVPLSESQDSIGGYRILEVLGKGGMGEVFLAWDERLQRNVAVKRIRHDGGLNETLRLRLLREAQAVARLSHPAIVQIYDLKEDPAGDCIVMEYVPGQTLTEALTARPFETAHAVRLAREIAAGLAAAHAAGIVHRDLKTENVILTPSGHAKILDFGLAKPVMPAEGDTSLTERGCVVGTCRSMSPEQARGREVDGRSDLFSLGVLLYEVLTGEHPFRGATNLESVAQVLKHHPPLVDVVRPGVPPQLGLLVERLLAKDAADRPQSADEVVRDLEAIEGSLPGPSSEETLSDLPTGHFLTPPPSSHPVPRSSGAPQSTAGMSIDSRFRRLRILALVSLGALLVGGATYYFFFLQHHVRSVPAAPHENFSAIQRDVNKFPVKDLLMRLESLIASSPHLLEPKLLAADMYLTQFESNRDILYLDRAKELISSAQSEAPTEAQPLFMKFKLEMAQGQIYQANATLVTLERLKPGEAQLLLLHSQIAEREGRMDEALVALGELVRQHPTWHNRYALADLEARTGHIAAARSQLKQILSASPNNLWVLEQRANIELLYGSPLLAEVYYQQLTQKAPGQRSYYTNLGNSRVLLKHYDEAIEAFQHALDLDSSNVAVNISLADAELARGDDHKAKEHYSNACSLFESNLRGASLTPSDHATRAQCLAHLEKIAEAKEDIQLALQKSPDDGNILQAAALVYAVVGEKTLALNSIEKARELGVQTRWFQLPAFASLNDDPDYKRLMIEKPGATP